MPTNDERLVSLENRMNTMEIHASRTDKAIEKINEAIVVLREAMGRVATKDDIVNLTTVINERHASELRDAHNSISLKALGVIVSAGIFLVAFAGLIVHFHG